MSGDTIQRFRFTPVLLGTVITVLLLALLRTAADIFVLVFLAVLLAVYLRALAGLLARRVKWLQGQYSILAALGLTIAAAWALISVLVPPVVLQTQQLFSVLPDYISGWETGLGRFLLKYPALRDAMGPGDHTIVKAIYDKAAESAGGVLPRALGAVHVAINLVAMVVMAIYMSLHPTLYRDWLIALFPPAHRERTRMVLDDLGATLRAWIVGQLLAMVVLAVLTMIGLWALQVPFWLPFGILTGVVAIVPFFGTILSTILPALFVLNGTGLGAIGVFGHSMLVILLGTVIHVIEANVVAPIIVSGRVNLPPVLLLVAVLVMGELLGPIGLIIAVPSLAVVMVLVRRVLIGGVYEGWSSATPLSTPIVVPTQTPKSTPVAERAGGS